MIRDVIVHLLNEQPVLVDIFDMPTAVDIGLICTNLRTLDGRRPIFIERSDSTFVFPYLHIRFVEILNASGASVDMDQARADVAPPVPAGTETDVEIDEDFLRRIREA